MPAVPPSTPPARAVDGILELLGLLFSIFCRFVIIDGRFGADKKTWFIGIAPKHQKSDDMSNLRGSCRHFGPPKQYL